MSKFTTEFPYDMDLSPACRRCGGTSGFIITHAVSGTVKECWFWDDTHNARVDGEDGLRYTEPKTVRCADCDARFPNPHFTEARREHDSA